MIIATMADYTHNLPLICLCLVVSVCTLVLCQPPNARPNTPKACTCPPLWATNLQHHSATLGSILSVQNNTLCAYINKENLLTSCSTSHTTCGTRENVDFCCCPFSNAFKPMESCLNGNIGQNVCIPSDITPWSTGLYDAFLKTSFGK